MLNSLSFGKNKIGKRLCIFVNPLVKLKKIINRMSEVHVGYNISAVS